VVTARRRIIASQRLPGTSPGRGLGPIELALIAMLQEAARTRAAERSRRRATLSVVEDQR
jgi:hypothetical protein